MTFNEELSKLQEQIKSFMKKETPDEELSKCGEMLKSCDELKKQHEDLQKTQLDYREKYIESIKNFGTNGTPKEDKKEGRSLEEIGEEVIKNRRNKE